MPSPNVPVGFDPTAPRHLPAAVAGRGSWLSCSGPSQFGGASRPLARPAFSTTRYWVVTKHKDVKEVSLAQADVFSSYETVSSPRFNDDIAREDIEVQRFVMLNMDAPHHTRLRKIIARGFTPRQSGGCRTSSSSVPRTSPRRPLRQGAGDFVEQVSAELPLQAIAGLLGVPQDDVGTCSAGPTR